MKKKSRREELFGVSFSTTSTPLCYGFCYFSKSFVINFIHLIILYNHLCIIFFVWKCTNCLLIVTCSKYILHIYSHLRSTQCFIIIWFWTMTRFLYKNNKCLIIVRKMWIFYSKIILLKNTCTSWIPEPFF